MHVIFDWNYIKASRNNFRRLVLIVATSRLTIKFDYEEFLFQVSIEQGVDGSTRFKGWDGLNFVFTGFSSSSVLRCLFVFLRDRNGDEDSERLTYGEGFTGFYRVLPGFRRRGARVRLAAHSLIDGAARLDSLYFGSLSSCLGDGRERTRESHRLGRDFLSRCPFFFSLPFLLLSVRVRCFFVSL